jgi:hypothetical protein
VLSLGATRKLHVRRKRGSKELYSFELAPGSVLLMKENSQHDWLHRVPKTAKPVGPRVSVTFRWMVDPDAEGPPVRLGGPRDAHLYPDALDELPRQRRA